VLKCILDNKKFRPLKVKHHIYRLPTENCVEWDVKLYYRPTIPTEHKKKMDS